MCPRARPSTQPPTKELCRKQNKTYFLQNEKLDKRAKIPFEIEMKIIQDNLYCLHGVFHRLTINLQHPPENGCEIPISTFSDFMCS